MNGLDDILSSLGERDTAVVFPTLEHSLPWWLRATEAIKDRHVCMPQATRTAVTFDMNCYAPRILRLWVPHFLIGEERTMPLDWPHYRRDFQLVSPYFNRYELRRIACSI